MMVGNEVQQVVRPPVEASTPHPALLEIRNLNRKPATPFSIPLKNISLEVDAGEVIGIAGVAGNGQGELFEAVSGEVLQQEAGAIRIGGKDAGRTGISGRRLLGAAFVPEERLGHGAAPRMKLSDNLLLSRHRTDGKAFLGALGMVQSGAIRAAAQRINQVMDVRKSAPDPEAAALSGGNLQKFIIGRELDRKPTVMVVNQPTWGVDAGAAARIRQALIELDRPEAEALVQSGTNLCMARLADEAERWLGKPVLAVNAAMLWDALRRLDLPDRLEGFGRLLREH
jgi:simple sugar transport system ATP-binding protein